MILIRFLTLIIFSTLIGAFCGSASAQSWRNNQPASCDVEFADVMEARAQLEAMREVEIAQTLILKPDSVLEYSCFNLRIAELNAAANDMFSDNVASTDLFQQPPLTFDPPGRPYDAYLPTINATTVTPPGSSTGTVVFGPHPPGGWHSSRLGNILGILVTYSLFDFVYNNFGHQYAGGTYSGPLSPICNPMEVIWEFTKCTNFNAALFLTFAQLEAVDTRAHPLPCNDSSRAGRWNANIAAANPAPGAAGGVEILATAPSTNVYTHTNQLFNTGACASLTPIPTGVRVFRASGDVYADHVCPAAGCHFDGSACAP